MRAATLKNSQRSRRESLFGSSTEATRKFHISAVEENNFSWIQARLGWNLWVMLADARRPDLKKSEMTLASFC